MKPSQIAACVVGFFLIICFFGCWSVVPPGHRGVRVTLGSVSSDQCGEGLAFKLPMISSMEHINIQQQTVNHQAECFSHDLQSVRISYAIQYRLPEARVVELYRQYKGDPYDSLIEPRVQEALKQTTAMYPAEEMVQKRDVVRAESLKRIKAAVGEIINVADLSITNIGLSDQLSHAIEQKMVQQQQALAKNFELDRERKQAEITLVQAKAEAESVKVKGEAITTNPMVIQLEIAKKWDGKSPTTLVTGGVSGASVVFPVGQQQSK